MTQIHSSKDVNVKSSKNVLILTAAAGILVIAAIFIFGIRVLWMGLTAYVVAFVIEFLFAHFRKKPLDHGWMLTPMLFTLLLPPLFPLWMVAVGIGFGVFFGKAIFGGTGKYIFNPAIVGALFLTVNFPIQMTQEWVNPNKPDIEAGATPLNALNRGLNSEFSNLDLLLGFSSGTIGETFRLGILILGIVLILLNMINWKIPVTYLATVFVINMIGQWIDPSIFTNPFRNLLVGGLMLAAFFFATDPSTSPRSNKGIIIYGIGLGIFTVMIRLFATFPEGIYFALILMSAISPLLDGDEKKEEKEVLNHE